MVEARHSVREPAEVSVLAIMIVVGEFRSQGANQTPTPDSTATDTVIPAQRVDSVKIARGLRE